MIRTFLYLSIFIISSKLMAAPKADEASDSEQQQWIEDLKSDSFEARENATKNLWRMGEASIQLLKLVEHSKDPEQAKRAQTIIRNIILEVNESTAPEVLEAVDEYRAALNYENKELSLRALIELQAYKQAVLLLHHEDNPKFKEKLQRSQRMKRVGLFAANDAMINEGLQAAIDILRVSPSAAHNLKALAFLLNRAGMIDTEIQSTLKESKLSPQQVEWVQMLYKAKGDLKSLKAFASQHGKAHTLSVISLLEGKPLPFIETLEGMGQSQYRASIARLKGFLERDLSAFEPVKKSTTISENYGHLQKRQVVATHAILGDFGSVVDALQEIDYIQLAYLQSTFPHSDDIWGELSIPFSSDEAFLTWLDSFINDSLDEGEMNEESQQLLLVVLDILTRIGKVELIEAAYDIYLEAVNRSGNDHIYEVIQLMVDAGYGERGFKFVASTIEDHEVILPGLVRHIFGDNKDIDLLSARIKKEFPDWDATEQTRFLFDLLAGFDVPSVQAMSFLTELESRTAQLGGKSHLESIQALLYAAKVRGDYSERLRLARIAEGAAKDPKVKNEMLIESLQAAQVLLDHRALLDIVRQQPEGVDSLDSKSPLYATALLKEDPERGEALIEEILTRSLGIFRVRFQLAYQLHQSGFEDRANEIFEQLLIELDPYGREFSYLISTLCQLSSNLGSNTSAEEWGKVAAMRAVHLAFLMNPESEPISNSRMLHAHANFAHAYAMDQLKKGRAKFALALLERTHKIYTGHGSTADHFFPSTLKSKVRTQSAKWFNESWANMQQQITSYPNNHDALNSAAWLAARTGRNLDEGFDYAHRALSLRGNEPSYLDTLAELHYARGEFAEAVKVSDRSIDSLLNCARRGYSDASVKSSHIELSRQNQKFRSALERANKR